MESQGLQEGASALRLSTISDQRFGIERQGHRVAALANGLAMGAGDSQPVPARADRHRAAGSAVLPRPRGLRYLLYSVHTRDHRLSVDLPAALDVPASRSQQLFAVAAHANPYDSAPPRQNALARAAPRRAAKFCGAAGEIQRASRQRLLLADDRPAWRPGRKFSRTIFFRSGRANRLDRDVRYVEFLLWFENGALAVAAENALGRLALLRRRAAASGRSRCDDLGIAVRRTAALLHEGSRVWRGSLEVGRPLERSAGGVPPAVLLLNIEDAAVSRAGSDSRRESMFPASRYVGKSLSSMLAQRFSLAKLCCGCASQRPVRG